MSKGKVLVIDDSPIVRKLAEMALVDDGYQVVTAENGEDGLRLAEEIHPSLILVDFIMPRMSGYQFCQLVREDQTLKDIPIILITAKGDDVGRKFSERFAVSDYFIKPFKSEALVDKVNSIVLGKSAEAKRDAMFETPKPFAEEPAVAIPFSFDVKQPAAQPFAEPAPAATAAPFAYAFEPEAEQPLAPAPFAFEPPQDFDIPTTFDASAFSVEPVAEPRIEEPAPAATAAPFAYAFEPEAEQPEVPAPFAFEPPQDFDIPTTFDASAFSVHRLPLSRRWRSLRSMSSRSLHCLLCRLIRFLRWRHRIKQTAWLQCRTTR
ncbi:MAG: transcriptional regulatory protein [Nitrospirae bacterium]|nr:MAG: transcriptional regulatory protein [Nitrospirota bacterium]